MSWTHVLSQLSGLDRGQILKVWKWQVPHPEDFGMRPSLGLPVGQNSDYRMVLRDGSGMHVRVFDDHYQVHLDRVDPEVSLIEHLRRDAPGTYIGAAAATGAAIGGMVGRSKESALAGALIGGLFGAMTRGNRD